MDPAKLAALTELAGAEVEEAVTPPRGCDTSAAHERRFTSTARALDRLIKRLAKEETINASALARLAGEAIKARRAASALALERERDVRADRLARHEAEMMRGH